MVIEQTTPEQLSAAVTAFINDARLKATGGLTVAEFGQLSVALLHLVVVGLDGISSLDGPAKKQWALSVVGLLFDAVATSAVPLPLQPFWLLARPLVRQLALALASGAIEQILVHTRAAGGGVLLTPGPEVKPA